MKIAILTTFTEFSPGYSLTGIVKDQVAMLLKHGNQVDLYVNEQYGGEGEAEIHPTGHPDFKLCKKIPFAHLVDYRSSKAISADHLTTIQQMKELLLQVAPKYDIIFTHDLVFTGWNLPYAIGILQASVDLPQIRFLHWVHSIPSQLFDWWNIQAYGPKHRIVYPNKSDRIRVAEQFRGLPHQVEVIPHIKDLRTWFDFSAETCEFIDEFPAVMQADIVQILPASVDRLKAKRVDVVIDILAALKRRGFSVCLVVANQWATQTQQKQDVDHYLKVGKRKGMDMMGDLIFTSKWREPKYETGIPKHMLRELFQCSNLFVFPTREESFGLVVPEASLAGGVLMVLNKSLDQQVEISGLTTLYFDFGAYNRNVNIPNPAQYVEDIASIILSRMQHNESVLTKTFMRQSYNMDSLYTSYYDPIMKGSCTW
jgi:glycosyltransferase involved in cell wall biosynthesis